MDKKIEKILTINVSENVVKKLVDEYTGSGYTNIHDDSVIVSCRTIHNKASFCEITGLKTVDMEDVEYVLLEHDEYDEFE